MLWVNISHSKKPRQSFFGLHVVLHKWYSFLELVPLIYADPGSARQPKRIEREPPKRAD